MILSIYEPSRGKIFSENYQILAPRDVLLGKDFVSEILRLREKHMKPWIFLLLLWKEVL